MKIPTIAVLICLEIVANARVAPRIRGRVVRLHRRSPVASAHYFLGDPLVALQGMDGVLLDKRDDESSDKEKNSHKKPEPEPKKEPRSLLAIIKDSARDFSRTFGFVE
ncbi:hypothetical protein BSLG_004236 [Batrachochytrium salamandrivorans]|nr:hypothetical protein BASA62_006772 [Batrachochytrium salamandrivorans]KAH6577414.1 hypothetical protein BASA60_004040 [Batrachochytrium salamandrivorans]KAH9251176.1 hypothetical protein BASA81_010954 [Batrachochytrium salamandrivorans]KAH9264397.1 hypothetical protein BASA83_012154 [Batrachochytrium salamandrivorans]KAJ1341172.1 hypothetical protein BSLG_004236 [Batrachochytrium salamandrivorans]